MEKTITTGTEITFIKTGDKFELIQTHTGFDVKPIKLSKNIPTEPYTFQELLDLYEAGKITIAGFEEADAALVKSILTNYIHQTNLQETLKEIEDLKLQITNYKLQIEQLTTANTELTTANTELTTANTELSTANTELISKNKELNKAIEAMQETE